jgi:RES domain-containing protein
MLVCRITPKIFSASLHAPGVAGRWNGTGRRVVYASESIPLAFMENMIRRKGLGFNNDYGIMIIEIPDKLTITAVDVEMLAPGWRDFMDYSICQAIGNNWYDKSLSPILKVPSAVLATNFNYAINTLHADYKQVKLIDVSDLVPDERIEDLLKKYSAKPY